MENKSFHPFENFNEADNSIPENECFHNTDDECDTDPIPFLYWKMIDIMKEIKQIKQKLDSTGNKKSDSEKICCPGIIGRALSARCSDMPPISPDAAAGVPWDEFYIWLNSSNE